MSHSLVGAQGSICGESAIGRRNYRLYLPTNQPRYTCTDHERVTSRTASGRRVARQSPASHHSAACPRISPYLADPLPSGLQPVFRPLSHPPARLPGSIRKLRQQLRPAALLCNHGRQTGSATESVPLQLTSSFRQRTPSVQLAYRQRVDGQF
ncbi:hypothetical protein PMIN02_001485 [Paraphaeosphaeria minitans]|uniref:Uncharacterized protein n=1 Tax=Paraphaeosphaeria minitans TaxID=565426 RepID=A0A9P6G7I6_9PLEO|nr:hypothetical protein PMIN01_11401 [Paraphaeosphaeria minitans]